MNSAIDEDLFAQLTSAFSRRDLDAIVAWFAEDGQFVNAEVPARLATAIRAAAKSETSSPRCSQTVPISLTGHFSRIGFAATRPSYSGTARQRRERVRCRTGSAATC